MLKRVEVRNYRSLKEVTLNLNEFNVLVGLNATGKSNIIDCLSLISESLNVFYDLSDVLEKRGGFQRVVFQGESEFSIKANFSLDREYEYHLKCNKRGVRGYIEERWLKSDETILISQNRDEGKYITKDGKEERFNVSWREIIDNVSCDYALKYLSRWRFYSFSTPKIRGTLPAKRQLVLERDGGNLAQVLLSLHNERPKTFAEIEEMLKSAIPEIEELLTPLTEKGETYIAVREKNYSKPFDYHQISDGTLRLLAYITAINLDADLICFEEPENFVHPSLLRLLVEILKKCDKQVIVSTHSPYFIDHVEPDDLIIVEKKEGKTKVRRIEKEEDKKRIKTLLNEGIPLGEAYCSGAI